MFASWIIKFSDTFSTLNCERNAHEIQKTKKKTIILIFRQNDIFKPNFTFHIYRVVIVVVNSTITIFNSLPFRNGRILLTFRSFHIVSIYIHWIPTNLIHILWFITVLCPKFTYEEFEIQKWILFNQNYVTNN